MSDTDLTFATTEELVDEMFKRHEAIAIVRIPKGQQGHEVLVDHTGPFYTVLGMADQLHHDLINRAVVKDQP
jgi:hypothetical protein